MRRVKVSFLRDTTIWGDCESEIPGDPEGGTPIKSGWVCVAKGLKPWPYLRMNQTKIDTLSKAQTRKMTPYAKEERKGEKHCMTIQTTTNRQGKTQSFFKIALVIP